MGAWSSLSTSLVAGSLIPAGKEFLFKLGIAGYTFAKLDLSSSLEIMGTVGIDYLSIKSFHLPLDSTDDQIREFHTTLSALGIQGYCVGPIYMHSEKEVDDAFAYAKRVGVNMIIGVPDYELLPYAEKKVKAYNIRMAIHNHGPDNLPYPTATDIMNRIGKMDERMGICLDIGHAIRAGENPAMAIKKYTSRIFDMHIKDVTEASKNGKNIEVGRGIINLPEFFDVLSHTKYNGVCSLEYEKNMENPRVGIAESIGYLRGVLDAI